MENLRYCLNVNFLPQDTYLLKAKIGELHEQLSVVANNTLSGNPYVMQITSKSFIGRFSQNQFKLICAQLPFGLAVVLNGKVRSDHIILDLRLHPLIKFFFYFFSSFLVVAFVLSALQEFELISLVSTLLFLLIVRFGFIGGAYYQGKKLALSKLDLLFNREYKS
jgi:ABC-type xylose transport system permease subunit